jgi:hypothetical protein
VHDALLHDRAFPGGGDRLRQALQPVAHADQDIVDAAVLQLGEHLQPEPCALGTVAGPNPQDVPLAVGGDAHHHVERGVADLAVADLDHDGVHEDHRIERVQRSAGPFGQLAGDLRVILLIVSLDTLAPYTSSKCAAISPVVRPRADNDNTIWSIPSRRRAE